ncbi:oxidoreductase [Gemmatimonadetes bacterium T265]|nr:oxidoreductase [Gemmatimonadetes bacterium T265]
MTTHAFPAAAAVALLAVAACGLAACGRTNAPLIGPPVGGEPFDRSLLAGGPDPWRTLPRPFWTAQPAPDAGGASLRGVRAVSAQVAWASGSGGTVLRTTDGGTTWRRRLVPGADALDFRSVWAFDSLTAIVASAGDGAAGQARLYRTADGGRSWTLVRQDTARGVFYDAVAFWDRQYGLVLSDPVGEGAARHFFVLATSDGGATWRPTPAEGMPTALPDEGAFAAGNAALAVGADTRAWFATGGPNGARVFTTTTGGARWDAVAAPVTPRGTSAGLFAVAGAPGGGGTTVTANLRERTLRALPTPALAVGGDYRQARTGTGQIVRTDDGNRWERTDLGGTAPGYWSGLAYVPGLERTAVAVGGAGAAVTRDDGRTWTPVDSTEWNAVSFAGASAGWAVGPRGRIARVAR